MSFNGALKKPKVYSYFVEGLECFFEYRITEDFPVFDIEKY